MYCDVYLHVHYVVPAKKNVRIPLNAVFPGRWIGRSLVFETPVGGNGHGIVAACNVIQNTSGIFVRVRQNFVRRYHA